MRKKAVYIVAVVILAVMILALRNIGKNIENRIAAVRSVSAAAFNQETVVVLDAGHGGIDVGKVGINGIEEKEININIVKEIKKYLENKGVSVILTREGDERLSDSQRADLEERVKIINKTSPDLAVSIHQNSYLDESVRGPQVFYHTGSDEGERAAAIIQEMMNQNDKENTRTIKANNTYYLLKRTEAVTVIVECGFLSCPDEAEKLSLKANQSELAKIIAQGILQYLNV